MKNAVLLLSFLFLLINGNAQSLQMPPSGDNQKCIVTQYVGPAWVKVTYNSPDVTAPNGEDRRGQIWGELVPYGMADNSFGTAKKIPWRAGANENTTIEFSHDAKIEGKTIKAGKYGLHMIPGKEQWTIIFSNNSSSWGSYYYDEKEDALRVMVETEKSDFHNWLTFSFIDRMPDHTVLALEWEDISVPFNISFDVNKIYVDQFREDLRGETGFNWLNWNSAANFCLERSFNLEEALEWANTAISAPYIGKRNFTTLKTKAGILAALEREEEANSLMDSALRLPSATMSDIHFYGRELIAAGKPEMALEVFTYNRERFPDDNFTTFVGLARGYEAIGDKKRASKYFLKASENAPEDQKEYYVTIAKSLSGEE